MSMEKRIGLAIGGPSTGDVLEQIQQAEELGIQAAWLSTGGARRDGLTQCAAAAVRTERIVLGTAVQPIWSRHPVAMAQQAWSVAELASGRFCLGVGTSSKTGTVRTFGVDFQAPLGHLGEYIRILKALIQQGQVDFEGEYYQAHAQTGAPLAVPVVMAALRRRSFELCGAEADGAITLLCPGPYLRDVALPAMQKGAEQAGRPVPSLIAQVPVCVHDDLEEVRTVVREEMGFFGSGGNPSYGQMLADAGFPEVAESNTWSDQMIEAVILSGDEARVKDRILEMFDFGASELIVRPLPVGTDRGASLERTLQLVGEVARSVAST